MILNKHQKAMKHELEIITSVRNSKSFFARNFSSKKNEKEHTEAIHGFDVAVNRTETIIDELQNLIDRTPNSKADQKKMLNELKCVKKNLVLEKREY